MLQVYRRPLWTDVAAVGASAAAASAAGSAGGFVFPASGGARWVLAVAGGLGLALALLATRRAPDWVRSDGPDLVVRCGRHVHRCPRATARLRRLAAGRWQLVTPGGRFTLFADRSGGPGRLPALCAAAA